ncbi:unnamed protein product [Ectocarpus sp. CCAP 1310/34]|nr:unnamed protein product [Ectocarpus sp. CCAP 1310/34]
MSGRKDGDDSSSDSAAEDRKRSREELVTLRTQVSSLTDQMSQLMSLVEDAMKASKKEEPAGTMEGAADCGDARESAAAESTNAEGGAPWTGSAQDGRYLREPIRESGPSGRHSGEAGALSPKRGFVPQEVRVAAAHNQDNSSAMGDGGVGFGYGATTPATGYQSVRYTSPPFSGKSKDFNEWRNDFRMAANGANLLEQFEESGSLEIPVNSGKSKFSLSQQYRSEQVELAFHAWNFLPRALKEKDRKIMKRAETPQGALRELKTIHNPESSVQPSEDLKSLTSTKISRGGDGDSGGDPGDSENLEELKYDPADDRYPRGLEGKKLLWGASNAGPLRHGLDSGRTRKQTREMQGAGEMPGPGETPDPEEALLATILETGGTGIVEDYICNSLVKEQWDEEQTRRMEEMYRREMQEVLGPEQQAVGAAVDASGSSQPLPDPQLSMTSPIGQKPSDVEAVPMTYKDVMCSKYKVFWEAAMKKEIDGHDKTGTFTKVKELPEGRKAIGSKWVFSWKTNEKGLIVDFKARMVARGFSQIPGIDFHRSSSACPSAASIKTVIAVATEKGKKLAHWDVKQAYIHAKLKEEIYLRFPEGCGSMSGKVVKVERALYGLKQSGREWGFEAADALIENGYEQCRVDPCVFRKVVDGEVVGLIVIYVDDILVAADEGEREELFASLNKKFPVKIWGSVLGTTGVLSP